MFRGALATTAAGTICLAAYPALAAGPVSVTEEPVITPPAASAALGGDWTGPYVGGQFGWGRARGDLEGDPADFGFDDALEDFEAGLDGDGVAGGVSAGYRYDLGQWVVGAEAQYDWAGIDFDQVDIDSGSLDVEAELEEEEGSLDEIWRLKGIAGYDLGRTLVYGSLGWAHASGEFGGNDIDGDGWQIGAGADYMLNDNLSLGGELMHHQFHDFGGEGSDMDFTTLQAKITLSF